MKLLNEAILTPLTLGCDFSQSLARYSDVSASPGLPCLGLSISCAADCPNNPVKTSDAGRALANHSGVASGASVSSNSGLGLRGIAGFCMKTQLIAILYASAQHPYHSYVCLFKSGIEKTKRISSMPLVKPGTEQLHKVVMVATRGSQVPIVRE